MYDDLYDSSKLRDAEARREAAGERRQSEHEIARLLQRIEKMALVNQALYEIIKERFELTDVDIRRKMQEVDLRDGYENGKMVAPPTECGKCGGIVTGGALRCFTCGSTLAPRYPFSA